MCCVTCEQKAPVAPGLGPACPEGVESVAFERGIVRRDVPGSEQLPGRLRVIEVLHALFWQPHELPAAAALSSRHNRRGTGRVADLQIRWIPFTLLVRDDIDHQPVEQEAEIGDLGAHLLTQVAIGAVGANDVTSAYGEEIVRRNQFA